MNKSIFIEVFKINLLEINNKIYSEKLLKIIDLLLNKISEERPSPNDLIEILFKKKN